MDQNSSDAFDIAMSESKQHALKSVDDMELPKVINLSWDSCVCLGPKINKQANKLFLDLTDRHGGNLQFLMGIALRECWFACYASFFLNSRMIELCPIDDDPRSTYKMPSDYADDEGWAWILTNSPNDTAENIEQSIFREGTPYQHHILLIFT